MAYKAVFNKLSITSASGHWLYQRVTAVALVPLAFWLIIFLDKALNAPYANTLVWLSTPINAVAMVAWTLAVIYHAALGVQVVLEDYVSTIAIRKLSIRASNLVFTCLGFAALFAIIRILSKG